MGSWGKTLALLLVALFLTSLVMFQPATVKAQSKTVFVPDDFPTIQEAINNANAGDTVYVKSGTYNSTVGGLYINKPLILMGENRQTTIIFNPYRINFWNQQVIEITSRNVSISGFTIESNPVYRLIGIYIFGVQDPSGCKITNNIIRNNGMYGIAKSSFFGNASFDLISDNIIDENGAGINLESINSTISNNTITNNADYGLWVSNSANLTITGNEFANNSNGGIWLNEYGPFYVQANNISDSNNGYGIQFRGCSNSTVYKNNIFHNKVGVWVGNYELYNYSSIVGIGNIVYYNNLNNSLNAFVETSFPHKITISYGVGNGTDIVSWNNGKVGNYWSDYNDSGTYVIDESNVDHHPLTQQVDISAIAPTTSFEIPSLNIAVIVTILVAVIAAGLLVYFKKHRRAA